MDILKQRGRAIVVEGLPTFENPDSQLVTASQFYEPGCARWHEAVGFKVEFDRKRWEYTFILNAIDTYCGIEGKRGLSFGCGKEVTTSALVARGSEIVATDYVDAEDAAHWAGFNVDDLYFPHIVDGELFASRTSFRNVDMNDIPEDLRDFDFCWSTGSLEHIGSHAKGLAFIENAMECLKPGGVAVHTTEFTLTNETQGFDYPSLSYYCRKDIEDLAARLIADGHKIVLNFTRGNTLADTHVDTPPYTPGMTLTAHFGNHIITSIGLIIQKGG